MRGMNNAGTEARQPEGKPLGKSVKGWRPMLRHPNIDYSRGWFFVTIQSAFNKTIFGAIVGEHAALLISPVETGLGLNKQRAVWCNEYILRNAA